MEVRKTYMKRYLAFYGDVYYPKEGMDDFVGDYDSRHEAFAAINERHKKENPSDEDWDRNWSCVWDCKERREALN